MARPMIAVVMRFGPAPDWELGRQALEAAAAGQTRPADCVLVVDDMAGVDERRAIDPALDEALQFPNVFCYRPPWMLGVWGAFNQGLAAARCEYSVLALAGDVLDADALQAVEEVVGESPDLFLWLPGRGVGEAAGEPRMPVGSMAAWHAAGGFLPFDARPTSDLMARLGPAREVAVATDPLFTRRRPQLAELTLTADQWGRREP